MAVDSDIKIVIPIKPDDFFAMMEIGLQSFGDLWDAEGFVADLEKRNSSARLAVRKVALPNWLLGFVVYQKEKATIEILSLAVLPAWWRRGYATAMVDYLKEIAGKGRRRRIEAKVRESDLTSQLFFRSCGFRAVRIEPNYYYEAGLDAYVMEWNKQGHVPKNRVFGVKTNATDL